MQHNEQKPYPCPHCQLRFSVKGTLDRHVTRKHTKEFPHICSLCGKGYCRPCELKVHTERKHRVTVKLDHSVQRTQKNSYLCPYCELKFTDKCNLNRHVIRKHTKEFPYNCSLCGKGFCIPVQLKTHTEKKHSVTVQCEQGEQLTQQKSYPCPHCKLTFKEKAHFNSHVARKHTKEFPLICSLCGKGYCTPGELTSHAEKEHSDC